MMTRTKRRVIFYLLIVVFIALGGGVTLYAEGYRLDTEKFTVRKVGAIYIRTYPGDTNVLLNQIPVSRPFSIFENGVLINDLFPKTYEVIAEREGFKPWKKQVMVEPSHVTEFKHAVLVPAAFTEVSTTNVVDFDLVTGEPLMKTSSGTLVFRDRIIPGTSFIAGTLDSNRLHTKDAKGNDLWVDLQTSSSTLLTSLLRKAGLTAIEKGSQFLIDPENSSRIIIVTPRSIAFADLQTNRIITVATSSQATTFSPFTATSRTNVAFTRYDARRNVSELFIVDRGTLPAGQSNNMSGKTIKMAWGGTRVLGILEDDGTLYLYDPATRGLESRANDVKDFTFTPDGLMLATLEHQSVEIFSFRDSNYWRLNIPALEYISKLEWYTDAYHLIAHYPDRITFIDLEDASLENIQTIAETTSAAYDIKTNMLYMIQNEKLLRLEFPK